MKKLMLFALIIPFLFLVSCSASVRDISPQEAKSMMDNDSSIVLVDVRTAEEYNDEHIPSAILLPLDTIQANASKVLPDKNATYIIYCRSGNRSADASSQLASMGYKNIYDMGGIIYWPYDTVS
ncbi:MAG: rhodanese-like domain-containing protein [Bacilli bacterium]|nr:rhodanese-like domain-containing protein [Bacilli bacterium]